MSPLIQVKNVTKKYGGLTANNDISFDVAENEILSVIGPNGAGKSTLFKMISSFTPTTSGEVLYQGERISNLKPHIVARKGVVRTFQETTIFKSSCSGESKLIFLVIKSVYCFVLIIPKYYIFIHTIKKVIILKIIC